MEPSHVAVNYPPGRNGVGGLPASTYSAMSLARVESRRSPLENVTTRPGEGLASAATARDQVAVSAERSNAVTRGPELDWKNIMIMTLERGADVRCQPPISQRCRITARYKK